MNKTIKFLELIASQEPYRRLNPENSINGKSQASNHALECLAEIKQAQEYYEGIRRANVEAKKWVDCARDDIAELTAERDRLKEELELERGYKI